MKKTTWRTLRAILPVGQSNVDKEISLEKGERIVAAVATSEAPGQLVSLGLYENNNEVSAPMDLDFWRRSNSGQYLDGFKPIGYNGGGTVQARIFTPKPLATANDLEIEIVFGIIQEDKTC